VNAVPKTAESRRVAGLTAAAVCCVYAATAGGSLNSVDAVMTFEVTRSLVTSGTTAFNVPGLNHHPGVDGRYYSPFGIGQSIFNIPFYLVGRAVSRRLTLGKPDTIEKAAVAFGSAVAAAGAVWIACLFAWHLSGHLPAACGTALALGFGTLIWPYSKMGFNAALTTWCLSGGLYSAWLGVRSDRCTLLAWGGAWLACALLTRHEMALAAPFVMGWTAWESRHDPRRLTRRMVAIGLPLAAGAACWLWYNYTRFGSALETGNLGPALFHDQNFRFDRSILMGILGLLFSPGRSLFIYVPLAAAGVIALVELVRRDQSTAALFGSLVVSFLVVYGSLQYWDGLRGYGPRYLVPLLPLLIVPLVWWLGGDGRGRRPVLSVVVVVSVLAQLPGVLVDFSKVAVAYARESGGYTRDAKIYSWRQSALTLNALDAVDVLPANIRNLVQDTRPAVAARPPEGDKDREFSQRFAFSLDFWWLYLFYLGAIPAWAAVALGAIPLLIAWVLIRSALERAVADRLARPPR
jgi:hypothetical protein